MKSKGVGFNKVIKGVRDAANIYSRENGMMKISVFFFVQELDMIW